MENFDKLRTVLANERTLLAYIRTALSAWIFGMAAIKFFAESPLMVALGWTSVVSGIVILAWGAFWSQKRNNAIQNQTKTGSSE